MRFLFGIIVGIALTIGFAYVHDTTTTDDVAGVRRTYVNWDAVGASTRAATVAIREQWDRLTSK